MTAEMSIDLCRLNKNKVGIFLKIVMRIFMRA
jgi:hypothetical protein